MWPKFPDICLTVEGKPRKNLIQKTDPNGDQIRARGVRINDVTPVRALVINDFLSIKFLVIIPGFCDNTVTVAPRSIDLRPNTVRT